MCRLLAVVSSEPVAYHLYLREAPRSLARLSGEHPDGWGAAICTADAGWCMSKRTACARDDSDFHQLAIQSRGVMLIAHIRQRTVGPVGIANTHPFIRNGWVFAHNGTVTDIEYLRGHTSPPRLAEVEGDTDSERLFAFLLSRVDAAGDAGAGISSAVRELHQRPSLGSLNFVMARRETIYVHRSGRSLYWLDKAAGAPDLTRASHETGSVLEAPELQGRRAIFVASEAMTDEPWKEIPEASLLCIRREPRVECRWLVGG